MNTQTFRSDEALLLGARMGSLTAESELHQRFYEQKEIFISKSFPSFMVMSSWERNYCFFKAFFDSINTFRHGRNKFLTYFMVVLHNALNHYASANHLFNRPYFSLDEVIGENELSLHDVVTSNNDLDDPRFYLDYLYESVKIGEMIGGMDEISILVNSMKLDGMSMNEIASTTGLSYRQVRAHCEKFKKKYKQYLEGT